MVVDAETKSFITQRQDPRLVLIESRLSSTHLILTAPGMTPIAVPFAPKVRSFFLSLLKPSTSSYRSKNSSMW
jgi:hypothetical protein